MEKQLTGKAEEPNDDLNLLKHDIRNQLSNINLAIDQLRYEIPDPSADSLFFLETIANSCEIINVLLKDKA